jgi:hypothetical protein
MTLQKRLAERLRKIGDDRGAGCAMKEDEFLNDRRVG